MANSIKREQHIIVEIRYMSFEFDSIQAAEEFAQTAAQTLRMRDDDDDVEVHATITFSSNEEEGDEE